MSCYIHSDTRDSRLFSAIAAMGIAWKESGAIERGERTWTFEETSDCGLWKIGKLLAWWRDANFHEANPNHCFHVVKSVMATDKGLRQAFKKGLGFRQVRRGGSLVVLAGSDETPRSDEKVRCTTESGFAAVASAVGFELAEGAKQGGFRVITIGERSVTRPYLSYEQILAWWNDSGFEAKNPQHEFAYAKATAITYEAAMRAICSDRPLVKWSPEGAIGSAYIHPDCNSATEEKVGNWLKGN